MRLRGGLGYRVVPCGGPVGDAALEPCRVSGQEVRGCAGGAQVERYEQGVNRAGRALGRARELLGDQLHDVPGLQVEDLGLARAADRSGRLVARTPEVDPVDLDAGA